MKKIIKIGLIALLLHLSAILSATVALGLVDKAKILTMDEPPAGSTSAKKLAEVSNFVKGLAGVKFPGANILVALKGKIILQKAFGRIDKDSKDPIPENAIFDLESISKVLSTATLTMILSDEGILKLDSPVVTYLPGFVGKGKEVITVKDLLTYSGGLSDEDLGFEVKDKDVAWKTILEAPLRYTPRTEVRYSDLSYRILGKMIETVAHSTLDHMAHEKIWDPLGMKDTFYNPPQTLKNRMAGNGKMRGIVEDKQDYALGGVVGCDGVFSTTHDMAIFAQMMLNGGIYKDKRILSENSVREMSKSQTPWAAPGADKDRMANLIATPKGYGWELITPNFSHGGHKLSKNAFGKVGGGGNFLWIDPDKELIAIYLTNHGLPTPFDEPGWNKMLDDISPEGFFDRVGNAVQSL